MVKHIPMMINANVWTKALRNTNIKARLVSANPCAIADRGCVFKNCIRINN